MKKFLILAFISASLTNAQDLEYVDVDVALRNPTLLSLVDDSVKRSMYYEDEGIERRIRKITQAPRIYLLGKSEQSARELYVSSSYETALYYSGSNRRAPPYIVSKFDCSTKLVKDANLVWQDLDSDCEYLPEWD